MLVTARDAHIVRLVGQFGMLPAGAIRELVFKDTKSLTSSYRALNRLVERKYLAQVERRLSGGNGAGSGQYVYRLGTLGRKFVQGISTSSRLSDIHHTMDKVDAFLQLKRAEDEGLLSVVGYATEPDSWAIVGGAELRPDLHVEIAVPSKRANLSFFIEIDRATERQKQLKEKMGKYSSAWENSHEDGLETFPVVLFLVPDDERAKEVAWLASKEPEPGLFMVQKLEDFPQFLFS